MEAAFRQCDGPGQALTHRPQDPTIFARSTGALPSAIAIIRISGPRASHALESLTRQPLPQPRFAALRMLYSDHTAGPLDQALVLWMPAPATATGDDLVELHVHGGRAVVEAVERALSMIDGLQPAEPGEFTRRAFANGRLDLTQVEGLADLLAAETERQRTAAMAVFEGGLRREVAGWQERVLTLAARAEVAIDFADEDDVGDHDDALGSNIAVLASDLESALTRPPMERLRDGIRVGIAGAPNVGKSSLINRLVGRDVAIASPIAGTTRDLIEAPASLRGIPFVFIDMAGLRDSGDAIEAIGVERAVRAIEQADILLWLDPSEPPAVAARVIRVQTKCDLDGNRTPGRVATSAVTGEGIGELQDRVVAAANALLPSTAQGVMLTSHQRHLLDLARIALTRASASDDPVLRAEDLREAMRAFDRITGTSDTEAMLDALFGRFCIGK